MPELTLDEVLVELNKVTEEEKQAKLKKEELRAQLFDFADEDYEDKEYLLPTTTITIPYEFWFTTGFEEDGFFESRYPTWEVIGREESVTRLSTTYVLRKKPRYMPFAYEGEELKLTKSVTEPTPDIDWETLEAECPDLFNKIVTEVVKYELDGDALLEAIEENPEVVAILQRHSYYTREPQQRVAIKKNA